MDHDILFKYLVRSVQVGSLSLRLCVLDDLDEALDYYVRTAPADTDRIPYFTQLWDSGRALAEYVAEHGALFAGRRVLEMGCGLGVPSLCAAKAGAQVTSTDFHPDCRPFFLRNAALNHLERIRYEEMDWRRPGFPPESFDVVMGSDLIYEKTMVPSLVGCAERLLKPGGTILYADPGRAALQDMTTGFERLGMRWELLPRNDIFLLVFRKPGPE